MLYSYVPSGDQIMLGSIVTFLDEIKWCKAILLGSQWRSNVVRLFCYVPGRDQML